MTDDTTTPIPAEAVRLAADELAAWGVRSGHGEWTDAETQHRAALDALTAATPVLLAAERERIAVAIETDCKHTALIGLDVCERCGQAARIARSTTEGGETNG